MSNPGGSPSTAITSGAARRVLHQAGWETRLLLRNGEQLLLTIAIPVGILLALAWTDLVPSVAGPDRLSTALATVLSVTVISSGFTSLAIATAFERRSGALRLLGTTPLRRSELLGGKLGSKGLTRDHIIPLSRGGLDTWQNCCACCASCNAAKGSRTLDDLGWELLYVPYAPSHQEGLILQNRQILADQMELLRAMLPRHSRLAS